MVTKGKQISQPQAFQAGYFSDAGQMKIKAYESDTFMQAHSPWRRCKDEKTKNVT